MAQSAKTIPETTREVLLNTAEQLFSERGYTSVGVREIAEIAGVNLAAISYHFGSKRELYLATVRRAMSRRGENNPWNVLQDVPAGAEQAAVCLVRFIHRFIRQLLPPKGVDACGTLIIREGLQPTEALDAVISEYLQPNEAQLRQTLRVIIPEASELELARHVIGIFGQMVHYRTFRPIIERLWDEPLLSGTNLETIADHIAQFTLRGFGIDDDVIQRALDEARRVEQLSTESGVGVT